MSESTQAFLMGISAALAGLLLYICVTYAGPVVLGGLPPEAPGAKVAPTAADTEAEDGPESPALARAGL